MDSQVCFIDIFKLLLWHMFGTVDSLFILRMD